MDNRAEADAGAQSYEVAFALDQPADLPLVPGMQMTVRLRPAAKDSLLGIPVVPLAALASFAERRRGFYVWRVDRATNTVRAQPVSLGLPTGRGSLSLLGWKPATRSWWLVSPTLLKGCGSRQGIACEP